MTNRTLIQRASRHAPARGYALLVALVVATLATLAPAATVRAASSVDIEARPLMGGRYAVGGWAAIAVTLVNDGEPTDGTLSAQTDAGTVRRFVEMPAGARKVVMLYVQPEAFQRRVTVRYDEPNGRVEAVAEVRVLERSGGQVAIVGDGAGTLRPQLAQAGANDAPEPMVLAPADIPERPEPMEGVAAIVWAGDSSALNEDQRRSIERWVGSGGQLVVVGGADWQSRTAAFAQMLPLAELGATDEVPLAALARWTGSDAPPAPTSTVSAGALREDARALVAADDGTPLLSMRPVGAGRVILLGPDLATDAFRGWEASPRLWLRLLPSFLSFEEFFGGFPPGGEVGAAMSQALSNLPSLEVPPAELLLAVIVGYILLIGPISYLVLRRIDRREMAWVTAPVLVVLFTACSYGIGSSLKGSDVIVNQIALIHTSSAGGVATVESYAGIFSPQRSTYDLRVDADALMARLQPLDFAPNQRNAAPVTVELGDPARLHDLAIGVFGFEAIRADAVTDYEPSLSVSWRYEDGDLIGTVTNLSDKTIEDVAYVSNGAGERVGDLAPGEEAEFEVSNTNFTGSSASDQVYGFGGFENMNEEQRLIMMRRQVIDALVGYGAMMPGVDGKSTGGAGAYVIGWLDGDGPVPVVVEDTVTQRYSHAVEVLAVRPGLGSGEVTVTPAQMSVAVIDSTGDASSGGPGMMFVGEGSVTYAVSLPLEASDMTVTELEILIGPDPMMVLDGGAVGGGFWPPGFTAEVRDATTGEWLMLGDISQQSRFEIEDAASVLGATGRLEVRITGTEIDPNFGQPGVFVSARATGVIGE